MEEMELDLGRLFDSLPSRKDHRVWFALRESDHLNQSTKSNFF